MIFRNLDGNNDWVFGSGKNSFATQNRAISLNIKTRILSWVGDCFFAQTEGIDWINRLGSKNQQTLLETDLKKIILQSDGVTGIVNFSSQLVDRAFSASYTVTTIYSTQFQDSITVGA